MNESKQSPLVTWFFKGKSKTARFEYCPNKSSRPLKETRLVGNSWNSQKTTTRKKGRPVFLMKRSFTQNNSQMRRMYRISTYIWFKFMVNVGNYLIHGAYGIHLTWTPNKNSESNERYTSLQIFDGPTQLAAITERHVLKPKKNHVWTPKKKTKEQKKTAFSQLNHEKKHTIPKISG